MEPTQETPITRSVELGLVQEPSRIGSRESDFEQYLQEMVAGATRMQVNVIQHQRTTV